MTARPDKHEIAYTVYGYDMTRIDVIEASKRLVPDEHGVRVSVDITPEAAL